ncbi:hypothetical protein HPB51_011501 [Rhipicephalus microplus]|uniref:Uncharacterized protein n=1 Tax=Rhipicephalus microplus TaxID=6941 RepID=A0A9J6DA86_RHIMP|nr:hypothetical protein HPB51_011501 [Rhipicephalus microplus]
MCDPEIITKNKSTKKSEPRKASTVDGREEASFSGYTIPSEIPERYDTSVFIQTASTLSKEKTHAMTALCDSCKRLIQEKDAAQRQVVELRSDVKQAASLDTKMTELREKLREEQMHCERQQSDNATRLNKLEYLLSEERQHRKNLEHKFEELAKDACHDYTTSIGDKATELSHQNGILDSKTLRDIFGKSRLHAEMSKQQIERPVDMIANCRKLAAKEILGLHTKWRQKLDKTKNQFEE